MSSSAIALEFIDSEAGSTQEEAVRAPSRSKRFRRAVKNFLTSKLRAVCSAFAQCTQAVE